MFFFSLSFLIRFFTQRGSACLSSTLNLDSANNSGLQSPNVHDSSIFECYFEDFNCKLGKTAQFACKLKQNEIINQIKILNSKKINITKQSNVIVTYDEQTRVILLQVCNNLDTEG
jgi:hypothetical protein